jgi:membrane fusion protein (multidrug efflux system)
MLALASVGVVVLAAACYFGIPWVLLSMNTVSTDDAYVNGHFTLAAARVPGQVKKVLTDDNKPVTKGQPIVLLDDEPYKDEVNRKESDLAKARADRLEAAAKVQSMVAQARLSRFKLDNAMNMLNAQVDQLHGLVSALNGELARRDDAKKVYERYKELMKTQGATTPQEFDSKEKDYLVTKANVEKSLEDIYQIRTGLGLTTNRVKTVEKIQTAPMELAKTPDNLDQTAPAIRQAVSEVMQSAAALGISVSSFDLRPKELLEEFYKRDPDPNGDPNEKLNRIFKVVIEKAPLIAQADANIEQAKANLKVARLNLSYCVVKAEIDGVVTRRNVNEGNNVQAGQSLMAIRSLTEIWIDANFKETQLANLRIGQPVKIEVDMYGSHKEFDGRITGFTQGTGQTLALLPPQNATGNFVKIVQRLPVKVELIGYNPYDPNEKPLFIGLSVTPYVYIYKPLVENDPGKGDFLQPSSPKGNKS